MSAQTTEKFEFPKTLPWGHLAEKGEYELKESVGETYAFYEKMMSFGFKHGIEIDHVYIKDPSKLLVRVKTLSGNSWGKGTYLICREDFFPSPQDAIGHLKGEERVYKPKRKPELIRPLTEEQINEFWNLNKGIQT